MLNIKTSIGDLVAMKIQQILIHEHHTLSYNIPYKQTTRRLQVNGLITFDSKQYGQTVSELHMLNIQNPEYRLRRLELQITTLKGNLIQIILGEVKVTAINANVNYTKNPDILQFDFDAKSLEVVNIEH